MDEIKLDKYNEIVRAVFDIGVKYNNDDIPNNMPSLFVPGHGSVYKFQDKKILYLGKDTNGWDNFKEDLKLYRDIYKRDDLIKDVINRATNRIENGCHIKWWRGGTSGFWDFVFKLQSKINEVNIEKINLETLKNNEIITQSFAWGNCNIFQKLVSDDIKYSDIYNEIDEKITEKYKFELLKYMINSFNPDIIVILNWKEDVAFIGEYNNKKTYIDDISKDIEKDKKIKIEYYHLSGGQHVFWTYHPTGIRRCGDSVARWVDALYEFMKIEKVL